MKFTYFLQKFPPEAQLNHELYIFTKTNKTYFKNNLIFSKMIGKILYKYIYIYKYMLFCYFAIFELTIFDLTPTKANLPYAFPRGGPERANPAMTTNR